MKVTTPDAFIWMNRLTTVLAAFLTLFLIAGCAGGNYGKLDRDRDLDNMFLNYEVLPDHRYYITGGYDWPSAILAIHKDYELENSGNLWVGVPNVNSAQMRKWIENIAPDANYRYSDRYFAAYILDTTGKRVGAWFAIENQTTVKFLEGNKIQVYPPQQFENINFRRGVMFQDGI
jgi:hypothetical protein